MAKYLSDSNLSSLVSLIKSSLGLKINSSEKGEADGVATLDSDGKLSSDQVPATKTINGQTILGNGDIEIDLSAYVCTTEIPTTSNGADTSKVYIVMTSGSSSVSIYAYIDSSWTLINTEDLGNLEFDLNNGYIYRGTATTNTVPDINSGNVFYIAIEAGIYTNFDNIDIEDYGINILYYNGISWSSDNVLVISQKLDTKENECIAQNIISYHFGTSYYTTFNNFENFNVGDVVFYEGDYYKFNTIHAAGEFNEAEVTKISFSEIIESKIDTLNQIAENTFSSLGFIDKSGVLQEGDGNWYNSGYIDLLNASEVKVSVPYHSSVASLAFFDENLNYVGEIDASTGFKRKDENEVYEFDLTTNDYLEGSSYLVVSISKNWSGTYYCYAYTNCLINHQFNMLAASVSELREDVDILNTLNTESREYVLLDFNYTENRIITATGFSEVNHSGTADIDVIPGEIYRINTYTYGGSSYAYAFYNDDTLVSVHNLGTVATYVNWEEEITIPAGVNKLYVSLVLNNMYANLIYKKVNRDDVLTDRVNSIDELGYFEETDYVPVIGKLANNACLDNITDDENYGYVVKDVVPGEIYHIQTGTTIGLEYAYAFYKGPYMIEKFLQGTPGVSVARDVVVRIPDGVDRLFVDFALVYMNYNRFSLKKKVYTDIPYEVEQIYPELKSGWVNTSGEVVENEDYSYCEVDGGGSFRYRGGIYGGACHHAGYVIDGTYYGVSIGTASSYRSLDEIVNIPSNAEKTIFNFSNTYMDQYGRCKIERLVYSSTDTKHLNVKGKRYASLGDSITADDYCHIGTMIGNLLETEIVGNFAVGGATCADAANGSEIDLDNSNANTNDFKDSDNNVLYNQVLRLLRYTTESGEQIKWTHPVDGEFSIDTSYGTGLGNTESIPDIIYIAIGTNDGGSRTGSVTDDTDTVFEQTYSELTRKSIASALRWAIETLQSAYPGASIFVATPLWTGSSYAYASYSTNLLKREIIIKTAGFCGVKVIDSTYESGYTKMAADYGSDDGKVHPDLQWRYNIAKYVANEINNRYTAINTNIFYGIIN